MACILISALLYGCGSSDSGDGGGQTEIKLTPDGSAVSFRQVVFTFTGVVGSASLAGIDQRETQQAEGIYSGTGMFIVDMQSLGRNGFVQVVTPLGWVVQNLPVASGTDYNNMAIKFRLGESKESPPVETVMAYVVVTSQPLSSAPEGEMSEWPVTPHTFNAEGKEDEVTEIPDPPPVNAPIVAAGGAIEGAAEEWPFGDVFNVKNEKALDIHFMEEAVSKNFNVCFQKKHRDKNIEAANNQCGPASVTNSLSWLKEIWGTTLPHSIGMGLKGDNTTVGKLDTAMNRTVTNRRNGRALGDGNFVNGKLKYLADNKICLVVKHQDDAFGNTDQAYNGFKSQKNGKPTFDFICKEICKGEDVEIGYTYKGGGGHWVNAIACGHILGKPFITFVSDHDQSDDTKGTGLVDVSSLEDKDKDGLPDLPSENAEIDIVVTESPPEVEGVKAEDVCPWLKPPPPPPDTGLDVQEKCTGVIHHPTEGYSEVVNCFEGSLPAGLSVFVSLDNGSGNSVFTESPQACLCVNNNIFSYGTYNWTAEFINSSTTTLNGSITVGPAEVPCDCQLPGMN